MKDYIKFKLDELEDWVNTPVSESKQLARALFISLLIVSLLVLLFFFSLTFVYVTASNYPAVLIGLAIAVSVLVSLWLFKD